MVRGDAIPPPAVRVCAVVVTWQPDPVLLERVLAALAPQVGLTLVLDNASPSGGGTGGQARADTALAGAAAGLPVRHHRCRRNRGLGWTQNLGARWAWRAGFDAVLLMDQDSVPEARMVGELLERLRQPARQPVAAIGPRPVDARHGRPFPLMAADGVPEDPTAGMRECGFMIASGMLIPRAAWQAVGPMRADLFIDHLDTEWCLRARAQGWALRIATGVTLEHRLGEGGRWLWIGRRRWFPYYPPSRLYYMLRNTLWLARQPMVGAARRRWLLVRASGMLLLSLLLLPDRRQRLGQAIRACRDGWRGRLGPGR